MQKLMAAVLCVPLIAATAMASPVQDGYHNRGYSQSQDNRGHNHYQYDRESHRQFYNGAYEGGRGGDYGYDHNRRYSEYDRRYHGNGNYYGDPRYYRHDKASGRARER